MGRSTILVQSALAALLLAIGAPQAMAGDKAFTLKSVEGSWGFSGDGVLAAPAPDDRLPIAGIGVVTFDGHGGCEISASNNVNGEVFPIQSEVCTYTVNPDGTGVSDASFAASGPFPTIDIPVQFVIVDGANELRLMQAAVIVSHFVAKRIDHRRRR